MGSKLVPRRDGQQGMKFPFFLVKCKAKCLEMVMGLKLPFRQLCFDQLYLETLHNYYVLLRRAVSSGVAEGSNLKHPEGLKNQNGQASVLSPSWVGVF